MNVCELDTGPVKGSDDLVVLTLPTVIYFPPTQPATPAMAVRGKFPILLHSVEASCSGILKETAEPFAPG